MRASPEALGKRREELGKELNLGFLAKADLAKGRILYERTCAACPRHVRAGRKLGPDLTGSGRSNLDYILEGVVDPSAVVSADYRMTILRKDGRILSGMESARKKLACLAHAGSETVLEKTAVDPGGSFRTRCRRFAGRVEQGGTTRPRGLPDASRASRLTDL